MNVDDRPKIYVVYGVDGDIDIPRAWYETYTGALRYKAESGHDYLLIRRMLEGDI